MLTRIRILISSKVREHTHIPGFEYNSSLNLIPLASSRVELFSFSCLCSLLWFQFGPNFFRSSYIIDTRYYERLVHPPSIAHHVRHSRYPIHLTNVQEEFVSFYALELI